MRVDRKRIRRYQCVWEKPHGPKRLARQGNCCSRPTRWRTAPPLAEPPYTKCWPPESCLYSEQGAVYGFRLRSWNTGSKTMAPRLFSSGRTILDRAKTPWIGQCKRPNRSPLIPTTHRNSTLNCGVWAHRLLSAGSRTWRVFWSSTSRRRTAGEAASSCGFRSP